MMLECKLNLETFLKRHLAYMSMMLECKLNLETLLKNTLVHEHDAGM